MNEDTRRQTGRTTRGLKLAYEKRVLYVVPFQNMVETCKRLVPEMDGYIVTASEYIKHPRYRGIRGTYCDHTCERLMSPEKFAELQMAVRQIGGEFLPE